MRKGFTLIELLVVVGILGVLSAGFLTTLNPFEQARKGRDSRRKSDLGQLQKALDAYNNDKGRYPLSTPSFQMLGVPWGSPWPPYIAKVPKDPLSPQQEYVYLSAVDGSLYRLYAKLERGSKDTQTCSPCGPDGLYSYGVSSSNTSP